MEKSEFTVADGIRVQRQQLAEWQTVLKPDVYKILEELATKDNDKAKDGYGIVRGSELNNYVQNLAIKFYDFYEKIK